MFPVVVLGSLNVDLVVDLDRLPGPGETRLGRGHRRECGGKGANQAVAAARAGARVAMVGAVGDDAEGELLLDALQADGVDTRAVRRAAATGLAMIMVADDGENLIAVSPGANAEVGWSEVAAIEHLLAPGGILLAQLEVPLATVVAAAGACRARAGRVVVNPSPAPAQARDLDQLLGLTDVVVVNESEAQALSGIATGAAPGIGPDWPRRAAEVLREKGSGAVVVTLGARGCLVVDGGGAHPVPAVPVIAVDAVAAGDSFLGALVCELSRGRSLAEATRVGSAAGALAVSRAGAQASIPHRAEIETLLAGG